MDSTLDESTPEYPIDSWKILRDQTRTGRDRAIDCVDCPPPRVNCKTWEQRGMVEWSPPVHGHSPVETGQDSCSFNSSSFGCSFYSQNPVWSRHFDWRWWQRLPLSEFIPLRMNISPLKRRVEGTFLRPVGCMYCNMLEPILKQPLVGSSWRSWRAVEEVEVGIKQFPQSYALKGDHARVADYHGLLHATTP